MAVTAFGRFMSSSSSSSGHFQWANLIFIVGERGGERGGDGDGDGDGDGAFSAGVAGALHSVLRNNFHYPVGIFGESAVSRRIGMMPFDWSFSPPPLNLIAWFMVTSLALGNPHRFEVNTNRFLLRTKANRNYGEATQSGEKGRRNHPNQNKTQLSKNIYLIFIY